MPTNSMAKRLRRSAVITLTAVLGIIPPLHSHSATTLVKIASGTIQSWYISPYPERVMFISNGCVPDHPDGYGGALINILQYAGETLVVTADGADIYSEDLISEVHDYPRVPSSIGIAQFKACSLTSASHGEAGADQNAPSMFKADGTFLALSVGDNMPVHIGEHFTVWRQVEVGT